MRRTLHVEAWGDPDAPRVICLHGVTGRGAGWHRLAERYLVDYRVVAPDLLGHGDSPHEPPWSIADHLHTLVATLGTKPAVWIGHSFGGRLAFELAAREPELVERLVLLDPAIQLDAEIALHVAELAREDRSYASFDEGVERRFEESGLQHTPKASVVEDLDGFLVADHDGRWRYRYSQAAVVASYGEMSSAPPPFEDVRIPTLLVLAENSYVRYDDLLDAHQAALGDLLEVVTVPGGHTVLWDALEETSRAVAAFIRD
ncbi:alpha/beta fold hydrolase [Gaiella sp.]|uniref:alpha/beta fold hydrolase n=1 Tax=Gaiella sp. TaxID=2663207 RepID=UPI00398343AF